MSSSSSSPLKQHLKDRSVGYGVAGKHLSVSKTSKKNSANRAFHSSEPALPRLSADRPLNSEDGPYQLKRLKRLYSEHKKHPRSQSHIRNLASRIVIIAQNPSFEKSDAEWLNPWMKHGNASLRNAALRALGILKRKPVVQVKICTPAELVERFRGNYPNIQREEIAHLQKAVVEAINDQYMLLVFQHPNPKHGLIEREFKKGAAFSGIREGDRVMVEIQTDSELNGIHYDVRPLTEAEIRAEDAGLDMPEPVRPLYNEKGERDEQAEAAFTASMNEWMEDKLKKRKLLKAAARA